MNEERLYDALYPFILKERFQAGNAIFDEFHKRHIPYAVHKGAVLSYMLYGNLSARRSSDIDLLLSRNDSQKVKEIFEQANFIQGRIAGDAIFPYTRAEKIYQASQSHQLAPYVKATQNPLCPFVEYDCNLDIFWGESEQHIDMYSFLENTTEIDLFGITIKKLTTEAEFLALCMHHYKDCNSIYLLWVRGFDKQKLYEIAQYAKFVSMDTKHLTMLCRQYAAGDYVCYCVHFANLLYPNDALQKIESALTTAESCRLYDCFGLCDKERRQWNLPFEERISDIHRCMEPLLTDEDRQKIDKNMQMM